MIVAFNTDIRDSLRALDDRGNVFAPPPAIVEANKHIDILPAHIFREMRRELSDRYRIIRMYQNGKRTHTLERGLTLRAAQLHCQSVETSSRTCTSAKAKAITKRNGDWFDAYEVDN